MATWFFMQIWRSNRCVKFYVIVLSSCSDNGNQFGVLFTALCTYLKVAANLPQSTVVMRTVILLFVIDSQLCTVSNDVMCMLLILKSLFLLFLWNVHRVCDGSLVVWTISHNYWQWNACIDNRLNCNFSAKMMYFLLSCFSGITSQEFGQIFYPICGEFCGVLALHLGNCSITVYYLCCKRAFCHQFIVIITSCTTRTKVDGIASLYSPGDSRGLMVRLQFAIACFGYYLPLYCGSLMTPICIVGPHQYTWQIS